MADGLWAFSLRFYAEPDIQRICLALQDDCGCDVNIVLCLLWRGARGEALDAPAVAALDAAVASWREEAVRPLRTVRRRLKTLHLLPDATAQEAFRATVKKVELNAEKLQQQVLEAVSGLNAGTVPAMEAARGNLAAYAEVLGSPLPQAMVAALLDRLQAIGEAGGAVCKSD